MARRDTKQAILQEALSLFSVHGYEGVSVKEIAAAVGVKDSSLYKHYASKQEIFDHLLTEMDRHFGAAVKRNRLPQGDARAAAQQYMLRDIAFVKRAVCASFRFFLQDPFAVRYRRMLTIEQYKNPRAAEIYRAFFMDTPLRYQRELLQEMIARGYLADHSPDTLALQFYAPFWYLLERWDGLPEGEQTRAQALLEQHVQQFYNTYAVKGGDAP